MHPKFYFFDTGVFNTLRPKGPLDQNSEIEGQALEGLVYQHLLGWQSQGETHPNLFFWRTKSGLEVDFVIYGEDTFYAIEVKNADKIRPQDLRGLSEFKKDYPNCKCLLVYRGKDSFVKKEVSCIPAETFLKTPLF